MSAQASTRSRTGAAAGRRPSKAARARRRKVVRRRLLVLAGLALLASILWVRPFADKAVHEIALPLRHEDIIRQQARAKDLDPALIAAIIYEES